MHTLTGSQTGSQKQFAKPEDVVAWHLSGEASVELLNTISRMPQIAPMLETYAISGRQDVFLSDSPDSTDSAMLAFSSRSAMLSEILAHLLSTLVTAPKDLIDLHGQAGKRVELSSQAS